LHLCVQCHKKQSCDEAPKKNCFKFVYCCDMKQHFDRYMKSTLGLIETNLYVWAKNINIKGDILKGPKLNSRAEEYAPYIGVGWWECAKLLGALQGHDVRRIDM
jgi:hypothetical protein